MSNEKQKVWLEACGCRGSEIRDCQHAPPSSWNLSGHAKPDTRVACVDLMFHTIEMHIEQYHHAVHAD